jgi:hypothetical protein
MSESAADIAPASGTRKTRKSGGKRGKKFKKALAKSNMALAANWSSQKGIIGRTLMVGAATMVARRMYSRFAGASAKKEGAIADGLTIAAGLGSAIARLSCEDPNSAKAIIAEGAMLASLERVVEGQID